MTVSRREVLIGSVATIAAANGPAFPTAVAAPVYVRSSGQEACVVFTQSICFIIAISCKE